MLALVFSALVLWLASLFNQSCQQHQQLAEVYQAKQKLHDMRRLAEAIDAYYLENHALPSSLTALAASPEWPGLATILNRWQGYAVSPLLRDGTWTFQRAVLFAHQPSNGSTMAGMLSQNACGTQGFDSETAAWCGSKNSPWYLQDTRRSLPDEIASQRLRLNRLSQKFTDYYNTKRHFPNKDAANLMLANGSITALADLAGYTGGAKNCSGQFQYQGMPIDCSDMFDRWGGAVGYQFESSTHILLVSEPPIEKANGARLVIATDHSG